MSFNLRLTYKKDIICKHCGNNSGYNEALYTEQNLTEEITRIFRKDSFLYYCLRGHEGIAAELISPFRMAIADIVSNGKEIECEYFIYALQSLLDFAVKYPLAEISRSE